MSIYATLWKLKFPRYGNEFHGCDWIEITAQGVPDYIGSPSAGYGYENEDPYGEFLPPPLVLDERGEHRNLRAVVMVSEETQKGTSRRGQEYVDPLLVLSGEEYARSTFETLHERICDALRGDRPRLIAEMMTGKGRRTLFYDEGSMDDAGM